MHPRMLEKYLNMYLKEKMLEDYFSAPILAGSWLTDAGTRAVPPPGLDGFRTCFGFVFPF